MDSDLGALLGTPAEINVSPAARWYMWSNGRTSVLILLDTDSTLSGRITNAAAHMP